MEGHYDDIDVLDGKKVDVSGVPSPRDIRNKKRVEYVPRTIRINEFTDASLRTMAEECDININAAINSILDGYVETHQEEIGSGRYMKKRVLNYYLDRMINNELTDARLSSEEKKWKRTIKRETEPAKLETGDVYTGYFWRTFFNVTIYAPVSGNKNASFEKLDDMDKRQHEDTFSSDFVLIMPEKKWYTTMSVLTRYTSKCYVLNIERTLKEESIQKLVDIINNSKTDKTLIKNLISGLHDSDLPFGTVEGSIW